jgi:hypothetical protein
MMMQHRRHIFKWLFALWMLCCIGSVNAASQVSAPAAWRTTPVLSTDNYPSYQFRSTSTYAPIVGETSYSSTAIYTPGSSSPSSSAPHRAKKGGEGWSEPGDDDSGIGNVPTPIGSPLVLLLMAVLYIFYAKRKKIQEKFAYSQKKQ